MLSTWLRWPLDATAITLWPASGPSRFSTTGGGLMSEWDLEQDEACSRFFYAYRRRANRAFGWARVKGRKLSPVREKASPGNGE
jgi:hypothetical protein